MRAFTTHASRLLAVFLFLSQFRILSAQNLGTLPTPVARLPQRNVEQYSNDFDRRADIQTRMSTCGFQDGDPNKMRTADPGFDCRVDTMNGLWGFCPVTVIAATDCGLAGSCVDQASCSSGCGQFDMNQLTTFTCGPKQFCSTALLTFGVDQTYTYIACGGSPKTDHYLASPTSQPSSTTTTSAKQTSTTPVSSSLKSTNASPGSTSEPSRPSTTGALAKETSGNSGSNDSDGSSPNNTGAIIGGVIGGIALLCFSGIAAILLLRRSRSRPHQTRMNGAQGEEHEAWYHLSPKTKSDHRFTGGWGPRELPSSSYNRTSVHPVELPG
ncbi:hypothetical protein TGAMA5MH_10093 [Trichoderma gamsii]|uniref:Mid2 domain-containing protein n=1 Tax=Trichoderma gamsii TaxID=398673 RepID=A0A2K0SXJ6_9HYPO|nr:hypothetical protein TGAMA5MH_10093 [Trichoderma gamsii]